MPQVTPNRTNHNRQNATFRGGSQRGSELKALVRANRRKKRKLINAVRASAHSGDIRTTAHKVIGAKRRWEMVGSAGSEYDAGLQREFERACDDFRERYRAQRAAGRVSAGGDEKVQGTPSNAASVRRYAQLGTGQPDDDSSAGPNTNPTGESE